MGIIDGEDKREGSRGARAPGPGDAAGAAYALCGARRLPPYIAAQV